MIRYIQQMRTVSLTRSALLPLLLAPLLLTATSCGKKPPASYTSCTTLPNDLVKMATCGSVLVAYQDIDGAADLGPMAYGAFNDGLVQGMAQSADTTPAVHVESARFTINGQSVEGQHMRVAWTQGGEPRTLTGYSVALFKSDNIRLGACFGLAGPGSEDNCTELLPYVMEKGLR